MSLARPSTARRGDAARTGRCLVCGAAIQPGRAAFHKDESLRIEFERCLVCGFISIPGNAKDFTDPSSYEVNEGRVGTAEEPGREFLMIEMAAEILGRSELDVLIFGAGLSLDFVHAGKLPAVREVYVSEFRNFHDAPNFLDASQPIRRRFDLVVAAEVLEHFTDPVPEFRSLLGLLTDDGLAACSTNIYDGTEISRHYYPFIAGHTAYYTPRAIELLARRSRMLFDFRVPRVATTTAGPRKRYVLFTPSRDVYRSIARYFGEHTYAPSE